MRQSNLKRNAGQGTLFFCYQDIIVLTNVFDKHTQKVPKAQIKLAKERHADFICKHSETDIRGYYKIQKSSWQQVFL